MTDILHFTNVGNLAAILADGGLSADARNARLGRTVVCSGDASIKATRLKTRINAGIGAGGVVGDYVPFYYAHRSPMLFSIANGNVPNVSSNQDPIIYLVATAESFPPPTFVITDGNAASGFTQQFGAHTDLARKIDWPLMGARIWRNTDQDGDRKRRRAAEFLVHDFVPWPQITKIVVRVAATRDLVLAEYQSSGTPHTPPLSVDPSWYF